MYDDGMYYATMPDENGNINNEMFVEDNNILQNIIGICGYTGIAMFLSYFDTYWDDNFIEEKYESTITQINSTRLYTKC